jgi:DNA-binding NtrC family response regulator
MSNNMRIVSIVDDEVDITKLFQDALSSNLNGMSVVSFTNPLTALNHFMENKEAYVLVISALRMPELNGLDLLESVKKLNSNVRTILTTAYEVDENSKIEEYTKKGIIDLFLAKPVKLQRLREEVSNMVHIKRFSTG